MKRASQALEKVDRKISKPWKVVTTLTLLVLAGLGCAAPKMVVGFCRADEYCRHNYLVPTRSDAWLPCQFENEWVLPQIQVGLKTDAAKSMAVAKN